MTRTKRMILITLVLAIVAAILAVGACLGVRMTCIINELTGLNCPGCGNTRATVALLKLDFRAMLHYNMFYPFEIFYIAMVYISCCVNYVLSGSFAYRVKPGVVDVVFLAALVVWTIVRNTTPLF